MNAKRSSQLEAGVCRRCGRGVATLSISVCPVCGGPLVGHGRRKVSWLSLPPMRYPNVYVWFVLAAALDVMLTWVILLLEGTELNPLAAAVVSHAGLPGMVGFKFCLVIFVVVMAELIGRRKDRAGRKLAEWSVALSAIPVVAALVQLAR